MSIILLVILSGITVVSTNSNAHLFITAPNIFHLGVEETISVIIYNSDRPVNVTVIAQDYPDKNRNLAAASGVFRSEKPGVLKLKLDPNYFPVDIDDDDDMSTNRYAFLVAKSNDSDVIIDKEAKVLVSFLDGVVLLQTDKPIYTPQQSGSLEYTRVKIRIMPLGFDLKPKKEKKVTVVVKNPQGVVVQRWKDLSTETGFITKIFGLSEFALIGNWTVLALHGHENTQNVSVKFEVKEYVLPKFSVSISGPKYILPNVKAIGFSIQARYTYGKPVNGLVLVKFSMVGRRIKAVSVRESSEQLKDGKADFVITVDEIKNVPGLPWFPDGRRLQVEADVIEKTSGKKESAIDNGIYFVKSPFKIEHKATAEYFKPALPFLVKVDLLYPDKKPARGIPMSISVTGTTALGSEIDIDKTLTKKDDAHFQDTTDDQGRANFVIDLPGNIKTMKIRVETEKDDIAAEHNTFIEFDVRAYNSPSRTFLYVRAIREKQHFNCDVFVNKNASNITFMVIARGKILSQWVKVQNVGVISSFRFRILPEMSPSSRLVAFFFRKDGEVVSDSTLLEIDDGLPNKVEFLDESPGQPLQKHPGVAYKIQLSATPGTRIGVLAVDQSVYILRNREKLNKKRVFNIMESLDLGCGVGSGSDSQDVFYKSGTVVITNTDMSSKGRSDFNCPHSKSKQKRSTKGKEDLVECCKAGLIPSRATCLLRAQYLMARVSKSCREEFLRCCRNATGETDPSITQVRSRKVQQSDKVFEDDEISQGQLRKYFPETWIFLEDDVGQDGKFHVYANLPDTITTWVVQAVGISNQIGLGVARPLKIQTFKDFFISLRLPYSVQRGEQISVIATVFNYGNLELKVKVMLEESKEFCTNVPAGQKSAVLLLDVKENDAASVSFPIIPIKLGKVSIKVIAAAQIPGGGLLAGETVASDGVVRSILVVPEGVERRITHSFVLDPQGVLRDEAPADTTNTSSPAPGIKHDRVVHNGMQVDSVFLKVPSRAIPGSLKASMSLTGNLIGPVVTSLISGGLESLLRMPMGCGEQTMIFLAPNVYVMEYLLRTRQVTADIESRAYTMIQSGYQRALNYRRNDKSFSAFGESRPGSTWLTAFAARVFCAAQKFDGIEVDEALVCDSVSWLLENQRRDGAFPEVKEIIHKSMMGGTHGDVAMTAFVLVSLLECGCHGQNKSQRIHNAVAFMETELDSIDKVNILALTIYALALAGSSKSSNANTKLLQKQVYNKDESTRYWDAGNDALSVETTAYALLAQMAVGRLKLAGPIVTWLTNQRDPQGGFVSTQDTCVALQALSKYSEKTAGANLDLRVSVSSERDTNWKKKYHIDADNALLLRQEKVTHLLGGEMFIDSSGSGVGQLQIEVRYNVPSPKNESCQFALKIEFREEMGKDIGDRVPIMGRSRERRDDDDARERKAKNCRRNKNRKSCKNKRKNKKHHKRPKMEAKPPDSLHLKICARYMKDGKSGMTIMAVGVFSGFTPDRDSLIELMENVRPTVDRFEISDRSVILYVSEISSTDEFCAKFMVNRMYDVGTVQPVPVKVYDYYKPGDSCTGFYSPNPRSALLAGICEEGHCRCSQDDCSPCVERSFKVQELVKKACQEFDFAVIGEVILLDERDFRKQSWITYEVRLQQIIKKRKTDFAQGDIIEFKKRSGCRCPELVERKEYLIMGNEEGSFFVLDAKSFVIPWVKKRKNSLMLDDLRARVGIHPRCNT